MTTKIRIEDLQIGMFIHLDVGWMAHPFPLSSFKIATQEQVDIIRGLGQPELRWSPERSDVGVSAMQLDVVAAALPVAATADERALQVAAARQAAARQAAQVNAQQAALRLCERQYAEACRDLRRTTDRVALEPHQARDAAQQLTQALLNKMLVDDELCVRVLSEPVGDRATAHAMNVTVISLLLARTLGLPASELMDLGTGALMHDVGKLQLPDRVRLPRDDFSGAESKLYRDHVAQGLSQGKRMGLSAGSLLVLAQHHEHADGSGFPKGSQSASISNLARIVAVVNLYDNLCNAAVPSRSLTPHEALSRMFAQYRSRFDPAILSGFIRLMGIYPPGSVVQLSDERYAMVMSVNAARPLKPRVLVVDGKVPASGALHLDLEQCPDLGIRRSLRGDQLPARAAEYLSPRQRVAYFFDTEPRHTTEDELEPA
jgi:HD-GYP domain-containing protein (c-di-GMP phosphodiesterase class II)